MGFYNAPLILNLKARLLLQDFGRFIFIPCDIKSPRKKPQIDVLFVKFSVLYKDISNLEELEREHQAIAQFMKSHLNAQSLIMNGLEQEKLMID